MSSNDSVLVQKHVQFALRCLRLLPQPYQSEDATRMSLAFFALSTLELLGALQEKVVSKEKEDYVNWIYAQQLPSGGFRGSPACQTSSHNVMTYTAILSLALLRDDFTRLDRKGLKAFISGCQTSKGSFVMYPFSQEEDVRTSYCAFAIRRMLGGQPIFNEEQACHFLNQCKTYDGGYGQSPGLESQGGSTYCALAALALASHPSPPNLATLSWLVQRQVNPNATVFLPDSDSDDEESETIDEVQLAVQASKMAGFQGRPNKDPDACYSFWIGASLFILEPNFTLKCNEKELQFLLSCQHPQLGGFAKMPNEHPDIYHTYLALASLSIQNNACSKPVDVLLNVSLDTKAHLAKYLTEHNLHEH